MMMSVSGTGFKCSVREEVDWLICQLNQHLNKKEGEGEGDSPLYHDVATLVSILQCPLFGNILSIQESLDQLRYQLGRHPSILPQDYDISRSTGELLLNLKEGDSVSGDQSSSPSSILEQQQQQLQQLHQLQQHHVQGVLPPKMGMESMDAASKASSRSGGINESLRGVGPSYSHHSSCSTVIASEGAHPQLSASSSVTSDQQPQQIQMHQGHLMLTTEWAQVEAIQLINDGTGLGFGIVGGKSTGVIIKTLMGGGVAERDGRMQVGDHILQLGDLSTRSMSSEQVAQVLRNQGSTVNLVLARPVDNPGETLKTSGIIVLTRVLGDAEELNRLLLESARSVAIEEALPVPPPGFGDDPSTPVSIHSTFHPGTSINLGSGDNLTSIPPVEELGAIGGSDLPETETFEVSLVKDKQGLGITIAGYVCEKEEISGIFVKSIALGSAADLSQAIQINDQIIEVDGTSLYGYTNHQAVEVLRSSGRIVHLRLARYLRGTKYEQLQQAIASTDVPSHPTPPPRPSGMQTTCIVSMQEGRKSSMGHDPPPPIPTQFTDLDLTSSPDLDLPPPPPPHPPMETASSFDKEDSATLTACLYWAQELKPDILIIVAHITKFRPLGGLGISLEGTVDIEDGQEVKPHHYIRSILPDGPVGVEGSLLPGDEILEVNGHRMVHMNHLQVVSMLKDLPVQVEMICGRDINGPPRFGPTEVIVTGADDPNFLDVDQPRGQKREAGSDLVPMAVDRLVKAKSDGSLAVSPCESSILVEEGIRVRSRSLDPITGLAMWSSEAQIIQLVKGERGLGFSILDYQDPMDPHETVIVVRSLVPGGVAQQDGHLIPGDRLLSVNGINLEHASLDEAVQALKGAPKGSVQIAVAKPLPLPESETTSVSGSVITTRMMHPDHFMLAQK